MIFFGEMIYTGPVDEFLDYRHGALPCRSIQFQHETHDVETFQTAPVVNFPNDYAFTRITEFKYLTGQNHAKTSIVNEFPLAEGDPCYPILKTENAALYSRYQALAKETPKVRFAGRRATYRYYNMDQVVAQALTTWTHLNVPPTPGEAMRKPPSRRRIAAPVGSASPRILPAPRIPSRRF